MPSKDTPAKLPSETTELESGTPHRGRRRLVGVLVVAVWLVAMGWLVRREYGGRVFESGTETAFGPTTSAIAYAVLLPGRSGAAEQRVGALRMVRSPETRDGFDGSAARVEARMSLQLMGKATALEVDGDLWRPMDPATAGRELTIDFRIRSQDHDFQITADLADGRLRGEVLSAGERLPLDLPVGSDLLVESGLGASLRFPAMEVGETLRFASFDPLTLSQGRARVTCVAEETLDVGGERIVAKRLEVSASGIDTVAWIDDAGEVVRAETPLGLTLERLPPGSPLDVVPTVAGEDGGGDFLGRTSVVPKGPTPERGAERLVVRLSGIDPGAKLTPPADAAQRFTGDAESIGDAEGTVLEIRRRPSGAGDEAAGDVEPRPDHLAADAFVQSDHPEIVDRARAIVGDETDPWRRAELLHDWVFERLDKEPVVSIPSALEVLRQRRGDCNEHTVLYAALARSLGIPTRIAIGLVWSDELAGFYYHAWPEVFVDGRWIRVDPTLGQPVADATHLKLLEGGIETWPRLLAYLGRLEIEVLEMTGETETDAP